MIEDSPPKIIASEEKATTIVNTSHSQVDFLKVSYHLILQASIRQIIHIGFVCSFLAHWGPCNRFVWRLKGK